jgi:excisionase family DNA binding protein
MATHGQVEMAFEDTAHPRPAAVPVQHRKLPSSASEDTPSVIAPPDDTSRHDQRQGVPPRYSMLLTVKEVEAELQLGRTRTYEMLRSGEIPVIRIGRAVRVSRERLRQWIEERTLVDCNDDRGQPVGRVP